jgi:phosphoglucosamine mutase
MTARQFFGTDGIRGCVGKGYITPKFMVKLGWAVGKALARKPGARVVIGKDTRLSGYMIESALESGLNSAGVDVYLLGPMPTPGVAYLTRTLQAQVGVVISASHNPYQDNGIKFFSSEGMKLPDEVELQIESLLDEPMEVVSPEQVGRAFRVNDAPGRYIEFCKSSLPHFMNLGGLKVVVDCAHGATYHIAPNVLRELGAEVIAIGISPDGLNINQGYGSIHPENLQKAVLDHKAHLGIAFDGDGDRVIMVDEQGNLVDGDEILYLIAMDSQRSGKLQGGGVVGTLMSNLGLEQALQEHNIPFARAKVGDRYVMQALQERQWQLGGESSGHIIWLHSQTTGDGIVSALQVLMIMRQRQQSLHELLNGMVKCPQELINVDMPHQPSQAQQAALDEAVAQMQEKLGNNGRILLRPSGTQPLMRVMVEARDEKLTQETAKQLANQVRKILGA